MGSSFTSSSTVQQELNLKTRRHHTIGWNQNMKVHSLKVFGYLGFKHADFWVCIPLAKIFFFKITFMFVETVIFFRYKTRDFYACQFLWLTRLRECVRNLDLRVRVQSVVWIFKISGCKSWCPKDLRVRAPTAPVLTNSLRLTNKNYTVNVNM